MKLYRGRCYLELPDTAHAMWVRNELPGWLRLSEGSRVEVIGGDLMITPEPGVPHDVIVDRLRKAFASTQPAVRVNLAAIGDGYIPDLAVGSNLGAREMSASDSGVVEAHGISLVAEVTWEPTAVKDRAPGPPSDPRTDKPTKWSGYARSGVPFYLLVDRDPRLAGTTLYFDPNPAIGAYGSAKRWEFGQQIVLPEPFDLVIETDDWKAWS